MKVLIACERSGQVRRAFRALGHKAVSCDLHPADDDSPNHFQGDVRHILMRQPWDLMIAHPECTHLAVSGARWFAEKRADGRQQEAIDFFMELANAPIPRKCIEQPVSIMSRLWRKPDQVLHPHQFGHPEFKTTCLWLAGLSPLQPTQCLPVPKRDSPEWTAWNRVHRMPPGKHRARNRSETYSGIAAAMAQQWGGVTDEALIAAMA